MLGAGCVGVRPPPCPTAPSPPQPAPEAPRRLRSGPEAAPPRPAPPRGFGAGERELGGAAEGSGAAGFGEEEAEGKPHRPPQLSLFLG